jgi:hypothetical protein
MAGNDSARLAKKVASSFAKKQFNWVQLVPVEHLASGVKSHAYDWSPMVFQNQKALTRHRYYHKQYLREIFTAPVSSDPGTTAAAVVEEQSTYVSYVNYVYPLPEMKMELWFGNRCPVSAHHVPIRAKYDHESKANVLRVTNGSRTIVTDYVTPITTATATRTFTVTFMKGVSEKDVERTLERWKLV